MRTLSAAEIATLAPGDDRPHGRLGIAETAAGLAGLLRKGDVLAAEADEVRAAALARALAAMMPAATVVVCPGTDALPGDEAPASPPMLGSACRRYAPCAVRSPSVAGRGSP
ncbi:hypothetical protein MOP88_10120 [Sphingomonas sp. WKB10]|nr:hypothetical protein [Sphingomonas sp. WKB10]